MSKPAMDIADTRQLLAFAEAALVEAETMFRRGLGAKPARRKESGSIVTDFDVAIERYLAKTLTQLTGLEVVGEEMGGEIGSKPVWVVDPIDGTANYSAGNPLCAIIISLMVESQPVVALTSMPMLDKRLTAVSGGGVRVNGAPLVRQDSHGHIGASTLVSPSNSGLAANSTHRGISRHKLIEQLSARGLSTRMTGSVGLDLAFAAEGIFDASLNFSPHAWDNAAGALLVAEAGGTVTDLDGKPWKRGADGIIGGQPHVHATIRTLIEQQRNEKSS